MKLPISVIILTHNEELNLENCLTSVKDWTEEIIVVDSGSSDKTLEIAGKFNAKIFEHTFENYSKQRNWALKETGISSDWVLNLDADQTVSEELQAQLIGIFSR